MSNVNFKLFYRDGDFYATWNKVTGAMLYQVIITDSQGNKVCQKEYQEESYVLPVKISNNDIKVNALETFFGEINVVIERIGAECMVTTKEYVIQKLFDRLNQEYEKSGNYILNQDTLDSKENLEICSLIQQYFDQDEIRIAASSQPKLDLTQGTLSITGKTLDIENIEEITVNFSVSEEYKLQIEIKITCEESWNYSDLYESLQDTIFQKISERNVTLMFSSFTHQVQLSNNMKVDLEPGLYLFGDLVIPKNLMESCEAEETVDVFYGGKIQKVNGMVSFEFGNLSEIPNLILPLNGIDTIIVKADELVVSQEREKIYLVATLDYTGSVGTYEIDVPLRGANTLNVIEICHNNCDLTVNDLIGVIGGKSINEYLPESLRSLIPVRTSSFGARYASGETKNNSFYAKLLMPDIEMVPQMLLFEHPEFYFETKYSQTEEELVQSFQSSIEGILKVDDKFEINAHLYIPDTNEWSLEFEQLKSANLIQNVMEAIELDFESFVSQLPACFGDKLNDNLGHVTVRFDPFAKKIKSIDFIVNASEIYNVVDAISAENGVLHARVYETMGAWDFMGFVEARIKANEVQSFEVMIPIGTKENEIQISYEGETNLSSIQTVFDLVGIEEATILPKGMESICDITLRGFNFSFTKEDHVLSKLEFAMKADASWMILKDKNLSMKSFYTTMTYDFIAKEMTGSICGIVELCGEEVEAEITRMSTDEDWKFELKQKELIHVSELKGLAPWLLAEKIREFTSEEFTKFPQGIDLVDVSMKLDLKEMDAKSMQIRLQDASGWEVFPEILSMDSMILQVKHESPFHEEAKSMVEIQALLGLGKNQVLMKSEINSEEEGFLFSGELKEGIVVPFDLSELTNQAGFHNKWSVLPISKSMGAIEIKSATIVVNQVKNEYTMLAEFDELGHGVYKAMNIQWVDEDGTKEEGNWEYFVAIALSDDFKFVSLDKAFYGIDRYFKLQNAGLLISSFEGMTYGDFIELAENENIQLPNAGRFCYEDMRKGAFLYGQIQMDDTMFENLLKLGLPEENASLVTGTYLSENPSELQFESCVANLHLHSAVEFTDLKLRYAIKESNQFTLDGTMNVNVFGDIYRFTGSMVVDKEQGVFEAQTTEKILNPCNLPGIDFEDICFQLSVQFEEETKIASVLGGKVGLGSKEGSNEFIHRFDACIKILEETEVFVTTIDQNISIELIYSTIFGKTFWKTEEFNFLYQAGELYFAPETCNDGYTTYQEGLHVDGEVSVCGYEFHATSGLMDDTVVVNGCAKESIVFEYATITNADQEYAGPEAKIVITNEEIKFNFLGGMKLFGEDLLSAPEINYLPEAKAFSGTVCYGGEVKLLRQPITFTFSKENGFQIEDWQIRYVTTELDYSKVIEEASASSQGTCETLAGLVLKQTITTECNLNPKFGKLTHDGKLPVTITLEYKIFACGEEVVSTTLEPMILELEQPETMGFEAFEKILMTCVEENAPKVFEWIVSDLPALTKFLLKIGIVSYEPQTSDSLICRGLRESLKGFSLVKNAKEKAEEAMKATTVIGSAMGIQVANVAGEEAIQELEISDAFFAMLSVYFPSGSEESERVNEILEKIRKGIQEIGDCNDQAREHIRELLNVNHLKIAIDECVITAAWDPLEEESKVKYFVKAIQVSNQEVVQECCVHGNTISFDAPKPKIGVQDAVEIQVYAVADYEINGIMNHFEGSTTVDTINLSSIFTGIAVYEQERIRIRWDHIISASSYELVWKKNGQVVETFMGLTEEEYVIDLMNTTHEIECGDTYEFSMEIVSNNVQPITFIPFTIMVPASEVRFEGLINRIRCDQLSFMEGCKLLLKKYPETSAIELGKMIRNVWNQLSCDLVTELIMYFRGTQQDSVLHRCLDMKFSGKSAMEIALTLKEEQPEITVEEMASHIMMNFPRFI